MNLRKTIKKIKVKKAQTKGAEKKMATKRGVNKRSRKLNLEKRIVSPKKKRASVNQTLTKAI